VTSGDEHPDEIAAQEELLRSIDYLRDLSRVDIARLIGSSEDAHFEVGMSITVIAMLTLPICVPYWQAIGIPSSS
jgi:hypothetical protein